MKSNIYTQSRSDLSPVCRCGEKRETNNLSTCYQEAIQRKKMKKASEWMKFPSLIPQEIHLAFAKDNGTLF